MIVEPTITSLTKIINNRFELVVVISKRARQISADKDLEISPVTIAAEEVLQGKVKEC